jgi:hypothetical protein
LRDVAAGEVSLAFRDDEAVKFSGDGKAAGATDECSAGGWRGGLLPSVRVGEDFIVDDFLLSTGFIVEISVP